MKQHYQINFRISEKLLNEFQFYAKAKRTTVSELIKKIMKAELQK